MAQKGETFDPIKTEFNMGQPDFFRWNLILEKIAEDRFRFHNGETRAIREWLSGLDTLYAELRPVFVQPLRDKFDILLKECTLKAIISTPEGKREVVKYHPEKIHQFENALRIQRQEIGAGVPTKRRKSDLAQIKAGLIR